MRIAVVGTGVAGLVAAWRLHGAHEVTVFEASDRIGGHVHTHDVKGPDGNHHVDTGFIVFNDRTYPNFRRILAELGVGSRESTMSFSVRSEATGLEYNGTTLNTLFAQRRNLLRPSFYRMIGDILRFGREAPELLGPGVNGKSLGDYLDENRYSREFVHDYIVPMGAAIWSTDPESMQRFPASYFVRFFQNHGMLTVDDRPTWHVVEGGSRTYVDRMLEEFGHRVHTSTPVKSVRRQEGGVTVVAGDRGPEDFDHVVLACHSDQALRMLEDPSDAEREILGAIPYQPNEALLHTDRSVLPKRSLAHAAWNYWVPEENRERPVVTYDMNRLQSFESKERYLVTLNRSEAVEPADVLQRMIYHHPLYTSAGIKAQKRWEEISGPRNTWYAGAYWGFGFHEDGATSGLRVAEAFGRGL